MTPEYAESWISVRHSVETQNSLFIESADIKVMRKIWAEVTDLGVINSMTLASEAHEWMSSE